MRRRVSFGRSMRPYGSFSPSRSSAYSTVGPQGGTVKPWCETAAKGWYVMKFFEAKAWRDGLREGVITPPPRNNPHITKQDIELYRSLLVDRITSESEGVGVASRSKRIDGSHDDVQASITDVATVSRAYFTSSGGSRGYSWLS